MKIKNEVFVRIEQVISASITGKGKFNEDRTIFAEFSSKTTGEITNHNLGLFTHASLLKHVQIQKAQGEDTFRQNRDCLVTIKVNSKTENLKMKFSLNLEKIIANLEKYPDLIGKIFTPIPAISVITAKDVMNIAQGNKVVIAKRIEGKAERIIEIPVKEERLSLENIELT